MFKFLDLHHRNIVLIILILISLFCWFYTFAGVGMNMSAWEMTLINLNNYKYSNSTKIMSSSYLNINFIIIVFFFLMWFFMMIAMMLHTTIPFIMMFNKISEERKKQKYVYVSTINFFLSYLLVWALFSLSVTIIHFFLLKLDILKPSTLSVGNFIGGLLFIFAGIYQMTPYKEACLKYCRNPIELLSKNKIFNNFGAFYVGFIHGIFCVGCCWVLMLLLFYVGIMNLFWIAGLSLYIILEKYFLLNKKTNYISGILIILWGIKIFYLNY